VNTGGLGSEPNVSRFTPDAQALIARERALSEDRSRPPKIQSADEYFRSLYEDPRAFREYMVDRRRGKPKKQRIAIIGKGDSANTVFESLLGFGPEGSYGLATASDGRFEQGFWYGQDKRTCEALLNSVRNRYSDVATGLRSGLVEARPEGAVDIEKLAD